MSFDWHAFCAQQGIPFVSSGKSVARQHINIHCPFCGDQEHFHMGLSLDPRRPYWGCWRNAAHRGKSPVWLIMHLLDCTATQAKAYLVDDSLDEYEALVSRVLSRGTVSEEKPAAPLAMPTEFKPLDEGRHGHKYLDYLERRGFAHAAQRFRRYDLRYCLTGHFARRLILPLWHGDSLAGWTGRDITGQATLRYRTLSDKPEVAQRQGYGAAPVNVKATLYNWDKVCAGGELLLLCEGPLDALKLDWPGSEAVCATAFFGMPTTTQVALVLEAAHRFKQVVILLDDDAKGEAFNLREQLQGLTRTRVRWERVLAKDPGELSLREVDRLHAALL